MNLDQDPSGSLYFVDDPGEHNTGRPRLSVTKDEAALLSAFAARRTVLEIGTGLGVSTHALARWAAHVQTVDIDPWVHENVFPLLTHPNVETFTARSLMHGPVDVVFIDGEHETVTLREDIRFVREFDPKLIIVHDANYPLVNAALSGKWEVLDTTHGLGLLWL